MRPRGKTRGRNATTLKRSDAKGAGKPENESPRSGLQCSDNTTVQPRIRNRRRFGSYGLHAAAILLLLVLAPVPVCADISFPARLQLEEVDFGLYDVAFTLPLIDGRKLRVQPTLPPDCIEMTPREAGLTPGGVTTQWQVRCEPASLAGEVIFFDGLLGTQTDIEVRVSTLDGREHVAVLKPSRPGLLVPFPPSALQLALENAIAGMRNPVTRPELWFLLIVATLIATDRRSIVFGIAAFTVAHGVAQWYAVRNLLLISPQIPIAVVSWSAMVPALGLARGRASRPLSPWTFGLLALLFGGLYGGADRQGLSIEGLSFSEQHLSFAAFSTGVGLGLLLIILVGIEFRRLAHLLEKTASPAKTLRLTGFLIGSGACALLLYSCTALFNASLTTAAASLPLLILSTMTGVWLASFRSDRLSWLPVVSILLVLGTTIGLNGISLPGGSLAARATLFFLGLLSILGRRTRPGWAFTFAFVGLLGAAWGAAYRIGQDVTLPIANATGLALFALTMASVSWVSLKDLGDTVKVRWGRALGGIALIIAIAWSLFELRLWINDTFAVDAALGLFRLPLLALLLTIAAIVYWPRRSRVLKSLGVETPQAIAHWVLLAAAFFAVPFGTIAVRNPFFEARAPEGEHAKRVLTSVLSNTYHAFNLKDEEELYDRLVENVSAGLVDDLYLDSRRRLTAGTREGAQVNVKDVSILAIDNSSSTPDGQNFVYELSWAVTARVQHLQHVHHRRNIYNGTLTITVDGERWKIAHIDLTSEDRIVI